MQEYQQILLADAYGGYNGVAAGNEITRAGCRMLGAHATQADRAGEKTVPEIAGEALAWVRGLYAVEKQAMEVSVPERLQLRQEQSAPILERLHEKLLAWKEQLLPNIRWRKR